jgi:hypothetical protein
MTLTHHNYTTTYPNFMSSTLKDAQRSKLNSYAERPDYWDAGG